MQEMQVGTITLEEEMATHTSILAWRIPWTEEPGWLQSMGSQSQTQLSTLHHYKKEKQTLQTVGPPSAGQSTLLDCSNYINVMRKKIKELVYDTGFIYVFQK